MESCQSLRGGVITAGRLLILAIATVSLRCSTASPSAVPICFTLCTCTTQSFATVDCSLDGTTASSILNRPEDTASRRIVLDDRLILPASATALHIKLLAGGQLIFRKDFFKQNNVNHLSIDGSESRTGSSDTVVEFHEGALCNNHGQFPEILVTNVGRVVMHRNVSCKAHLLNITNVKDVLLKTEFLSVDEAEVVIQDVNNLHIEPNAFGRFASSRVKIHRTTIESLPKLGVSFLLLSFNECNISEIRTGALDANEIEHLEFVRCRITSLRQQAITDRLLSNSLIFRGCYIHEIEQQFVSGSGIKNLLLDSNTIDGIASSAFTFTNYQTTVTGNHIIRTGKEWLHPREWVNVTISGNSFGEFNGILLSDGKTMDGSAHCHFGNNTITNALPNSFTFASNCQFGALHLGQECDCEYDIWLRELFDMPKREPLPSSVTSLISCQVEESLRYCFSRSDSTPANESSSSAGQVNVQYFLKEFCQKEGSKKCSSYTSSEDRKPPPLIPFDRIDSLDNKNNPGFLKNHALQIAIGIGVLIFIACLTWCICRRRTNETEQTMTTLAASRQGTICMGSLNRSTSFTPADRRIIANAMSWIKASYDPKIWSEINTPMQQLLAPPAQPGGPLLEETVKVRLIGTILDSLKRHEISATQIVALNDILFRQLGPPAPELVESARPNSDNNDELLGHIYDELQPNRGQLLSSTADAHHVGLLGDYASPLDHGAGVTVVPEGIYSEPVLLSRREGGDNRHLISPYAIGDATVQRNPNDTKGNLPDVIRPTGNAWRANHEEVDLEDEDEDEIDGEAERKTMLRPMEGFSDGGSGSSAPTYAISLKQLNKRPHRGNTPPPPQPSSTGEDHLTDGSDGNRSEHSGSSMQTVRIEDMTIADDDPTPR